MKSSKAEVKSKQKLSNLGQLGAVSFLALMLSAGTVKAADDFLWHATGSDKGTAVAQLTDQKEIDKAIGWLGDPKKVDVFVKTYKDEPLEFMQGVKADWEKVKKDDPSKVADFKKNIVDELKKIDAKEFGDETKKEHFLAVLQNLLNGDLTDEALLKEIFKNPLDLAALGLTDKKPVAKNDEDKKKKSDPVADTGPKPTPNPAPLANTEKTPPPATQTPVSGPGEVDDSALKAQAQQICDKLNGIRKNYDDGIQKLLNAANQLFNQDAGTSSVLTPNQLQAQNDEKGLEDLLPGLLQNALGQQDKQNEDTTPLAQQQQPFFPQRDNSRDNQDASALNQPLPQPEPPQPPAPIFFPSSTDPGLQVPIALDLPSNSGRQDLRDAQDIASQNDMRQSIAETLSPMAGLPDLVMAKAKVRSQEQQTQVALANAKDRASQLDDELEQLKSGARAALPQDVKQKLSQLQQDYQNKKNQFDQQKQMLASVSPDQRDQLMPVLQAMQQDVNNAQQQYNQYNAQVQLAIEDGNNQIKALAKTRDQLNSAVNKLQSQLGSMKDDETAVQQLINQNMQAQMAGMQQQPGIPNVNNGSRLQNFGNAGAGPRTTLPARLGTTQTGAASPVRGSLAGQK